MDFEQRSAGAKESRRFRVNIKNKPLVRVLVGLSVDRTVAEATRFCYPGGWKDERYRPAFDHSSR